MRKPNVFRQSSWMPTDGGLLATVRAGDEVTIRTPQGQTRKGRAVMRGPYGWVLNLGGAHGTPGVATEDNLVSVRYRRADHE